MYFSLLLISIVIIDFVPQFLTWQSRIHIGRIQDNIKWIEKVKIISSRWLINTPTIKLTDNTRLIFIDMLRGNYKRKTIQDWQQASLLMGLNQCYKKTSDAKTKNEIYNFIATKINTNGNWKINPKEIDSVILAYAILNCDFVDHNHNKKSYDFTYNLILDLKGKDGTIAYRNHVSEYRFVDTIGFICPFLVKYGTLFNIPEAVNLALLQISEFNKYALFPNTYLPCHTYSITSLKPVGLFGWGRGLAWYSIGLIDSWIELPQNHPQKEELTSNIISFTKIVLQYQNENGSWNWLVTQKDARNDSSTTATLAWFLLNAAIIEEIYQDCENAKEKAINYLKSVTQRNGAIDFSQGDTKAIAIHSQEFDILPFTQGFALRLSCK